MGAQHTSGPWAVHGAVYVAAESAKRWVSKPYGRSDPGEPIFYEDCANARLIAAAPELLQALLLVRMSAGWSIMSDETRAIIIAAIAKATEA